MPEVTYHHVELPAHDVLIAQGLPVESYLDTGDRVNFSNGGGVVALHPAFSRHAWDGLSYARLVAHGPEINEVRRTLAKRAAADRVAPGDADAI
jgi:hypothetical protein